jgi:Helix-turn-helix of insertion element transposase
MVEQRVDAPMTLTELDALNAIEQTWLVTRKWPDTKDLEDDYPGFKLSHSLQKKAFINGLINRGVSIPTRVRKTGGLSTRQVAAVASVTNFADPRSRYVKLRELGVTMTQWNGWRKNPIFRDYLLKISSDNFEESVDHVHTGLMKAIDQGRPDAIKFYMEVTGRYQASSVEAQNFKLVLARVMEAIQRNVRDPEVLRAIAVDFDAILAAPSVPIREIEGSSPAIDSSIVESVNSNLDGALYGEADTKEEKIIDTI